MTTNAIALKDKINSVRGLLEKLKPQIAVALPKHMDADRLLRIALTSCQRTPSLLECDRTSLLAAVVQSAQIGLEPDGTLGHAYLVPFKGRVQLIPGYKGLVDLARRSGQLKTVEAHVVHAKDAFHVTYGLEPKLEHKPFMPPAPPSDAGKEFNDWLKASHPGPVVAAYALAQFKDGSYQFEVMSRRELEEIRNRSKAAESGPWVTDTEEMFKKTVLRRASKLWPLSPELARAAALDDQAAAGGTAELGDVIDISATEDVDGGEKRGLDAVKDKLKSEAPPSGCDHPNVPPERLATVPKGRSIVCDKCAEELPGTLEPGAEPPREPGSDDGPVATEAVKNFAQNAVRQTGRARGQGTLTEG